MPSRSAPSAAPQSAKPAPPSIAQSPLFALQAWPVDVRIGKLRIHIPPMPASAWVAALLDEDVITGVLDIFGEDVIDDVFDMLADGTVDLGTVNETVYDVITLVSGRPWWFTTRLIYVAAGAWDAIGGDLAHAGIRADVMPLQAWMDALLHTVMERCPTDDRTSMLTRLNAPPAGQAPAINEKAEEDAFRSYMRSGS